MNAVALNAPAADTVAKGSSVSNFVTFLADWYPGDRPTLIVVGVLVQVTAVLAVAGLVAFTLFRRRPAARHATCLGAALFALASPLVVFCTDRAGWSMLTISILPVADSVEPPDRVTNITHSESRRHGQWGTDYNTELSTALPTLDEAGTTGEVAIGNGGANSGPVALVANAGGSPAQLAAFSTEVTATGMGSPTTNDEANERLRPEDSSRVADVPPAADREMAEATARRLERGRGIFGFMSAGPIVWRAVITVVFGLWLVGAFALLVRLTIGFGRVLRLRRDARPVTVERLVSTLAEVRAALGVERLPPVLESPNVAAPAVTGLLRPVILLPAGIVGSLDGDALRDVLVHECAHVVRRDSLVGLVQRLVEMIFWPHPLVHYMNRELARAREEVCDNHVLHRGDARRYARTLLELAERFTTPARVPAMGLFEWRWSMEQRIAGLLNGGLSRRTRVGPGWLVAGTVVLFATSFTAASVRFAAEPAITASNPTDLSASAIADTAKDDSGPDESVSAVDDGAADDPTKARITGVVLNEARMPVAGATVRMLRPEREKSATRTRADGRFVMVLDQPTVGFPTVLATTGADALQGIARFESGTYHSATADCRITLRAPRALAAVVRDREDRAVAGATVQVMDQYSPLAVARTDDAGRAELQVAADAQIWWVFALKSGQGFDYFENYRTAPLHEPLPLPDEITLKLEGAQTARLRVVDSADKPVAAIDLYPWYITKPGKLDDCNIAGCGLTRARSDEQGDVQFDWLPESLQQDVTFWVSSPGFSATQRTAFRSNAAEPAVVRVLRDAPATGTVTLTDGSHAAGILVEAIGETQGRESVRRHARTRDDGTFQLELASNTCYTIGVQSDEWTSPIVFALDVAEGEAKTKLDFRLDPGVLVRGVVTEGPEKKPAAGRWVSLSALTPDGLSSKFMVAESPRMWRMPMFSYSAPSGADGRYQFRVPAGRFRLSGPDRSHANLQVAVGEPIERNFHVAGPDRRTITGTVQAKHLDGKPVAGAIVQGESIHGHARGRGFEAVADEQGRFESERWTTPTVIYARSPDGVLAGFATIGSDDEAATVEISPAGTVSGRVVDGAGEPIVRRKVQFRMSTTKVWENAASFTNHLVTDRDGRFAMTGVVIGSHCEMAVSHAEDSPGGHVSVREVTVNGPDPIRVVDIVVPGRQPAIGPRQPAGAAPPGEKPEPTMILALPSRADTEAMLQAIGHDDVDRTLVDRAAILFRPQFAWSPDFARLTRLTQNDPLVKRIDAISQELHGRFPDSLTVLRLALGYRVGYDDAALRQNFEDAAERTAERGPTVRGTVLDAESREPVAGAIVYTRDSIAWTGQKGEFELALRTKPRDGLVWIEAGGRALAAVATKSLEEAGRQIELVRDRPIVGRVLDADDNPIAGATANTMVRVWPLRRDVTGERPADDSRGFPLTVRTDDDGYFAVRGLPEMELPFGLTIGHDRYESHTLEEVDFDGKQPTRVKLEPGCVVAGSVVDEHGLPVSDASVQIRSTEGRGAYTRLRHTNERGKFEFADLAPGRWLVLIQPERHAPVHATVVASRSAPVSNQFVVSAGGYIFGKVLDSDEKPIARAHVGWVVPVGRNDEPDSALELGRMTTTGGDGRFRIGPLPLGRVQLTGLADSPRRIGHATADSNQTDVLIRVKRDER